MAQPDDGDYVVRQGGDCVELATLGDGSRTVEEFYGYEGEDSRYSSTGTTELQATGTSQLFVYEGSEGTSLVLLHDRMGDEAGGGGVSMTLRDLPDGEWAVMDDSYEGRDDRMEVRGSTSEVDWMYATNRTDGGAYRGLSGLGTGSSIRIEPRFGEDSYAHQERDWPWVTGDLEWAARHGAGPDDLEPLSTNQPARVEPGSCDAAAPSATLSATPGDVAVGEPVGLTATADADTADVLEYRWDLDGDGEVDRATADPATTTAFWSTGTHAPAVTVVTTEGREATAEASVEVDDASALAGRIEVDQRAASTGEAITFDGSGSTGAVERYEWDFGDGATAEGATVEHAFDDPGTYEVSLTVVGEDGTSALATRTVTVGSGGPDAELSAPSSATIGTTVRLDASGTTSDAPVERYRWNVGDDGTVEYETRSPVIEVPAAAVGERAVAVAVTDAEDRTDRATAEYEVVPADGSTGGSGSGPGPDDGLRASLEPGGDAVTLSVDRAAAGERLTATASDGDGPVELRAVTVEFDEDVRDWSLTWSLTGDPGVPADVTGVGGLSPEGDGPVRSVTYRFGVDRAALDGGPGDVGVLERRASGWVVTSTAARSEPTTLEVTASSDALRPVALATGLRGSDVPGAPAGTGQAETVRVADVSTEQREVGTGDAVTIRATLQNTGTATATREATLTVSGEEVETSSVEVPPAGTESVEFEHSFPSPGTYTVGVDGERQTVRVVEDPSGGGPWTGGTVLVFVSFLGLLVAVGAVGWWTIK